MSPIQIESPGTRRVGLKYVALVAGLLVIIAAVLAQLWLIERHRRIVAEERLTALYLEKELLMAVDDAADRDEGGVRLRPIRRVDLPTQEVRWNGAKRMALVLGAATGRAMGFAPGDVIVVAAEGGATAPAGGAAGER